MTFELRWKAACGLAVTDAGFHPTTLTVWRGRLRRSDRPNRILDAVRAVVAEPGVLAGKTRRGLDSTVLDDAVATPDTVTQLIPAIRRVSREVPGAAAVIGEQCRAHAYTRAGKPHIAWDDEAARARRRVVPSGEREVMTQVTPGLFAGHRVRRSEAHSVGPGESAWGAVLGLLPVRSPRPPPNPPCRSLGNGLSTVSAIRRG